MNHKFFIESSLFIFMVKEYHKLVRDKIPQVVINDEHTPYTHTAAGSELEVALWEKNLQIFLK